MFIVDECFYKKREYLLLAGAYAIMALAKKDIVPWVHKAKASEVASSEAFFWLIVTVFSV